MYETNAKILYICCKEGGKRASEMICNNQTISFSIESISSADDLYFTSRGPTMVAGRSEQN